MSNNPNSSPSSKFVIARVLDDETGRYNDVSVELQGTPTTIDDDVVVVHAEAVPLVEDSPLQLQGFLVDGSMGNPPGAPEGGEWGTLRYFGPVTQLFCCATCLVTGVPGMIIFCILDPACDEQRVYKASDNIYDSDGRYLCPHVRSRGRFQPIRAQEMERR